MGRSWRDEDDPGVDFEDVEVIAETEKAYRLGFDEDSIWTPKSVIIDIEDGVEVGSVVSLTLKTWFAKKEGLYED